VIERELSAVGAIALGAMVAEGLTGLIKRYFRKDLPTPPPRRWRWVALALGALVLVTFLIVALVKLWWRIL